MRIDPDVCRDPDLLAAEVRRLNAVIAAGDPTLTAEEREAIEYFAAFSSSRHAPLHTGEDDMTDLPGRLRVMARLTGRDDDADTAAEAAREIARLRLTDAEREAVSEVVDCLTETGTALANPTATRNTLASLLDRLA